MNTTNRIQISNEPGTDLLRWVHCDGYEEQYFKGNPNNTPWARVWYIVEYRNSIEGDVIKGVKIPMVISDTTIVNFANGNIIEGEVPEGVTVVGELTFIQTLIYYGLKTNYELLDEYIPVLDARGLFNKDSYSKKQVELLQEIYPD